MPKSYKLLLTDNVESLGIVGDVVTVRAGYARNFLLPRELATTPSAEKIASLAAKRAAAEKMLSELRAQRESMIEKLEGYELTLERSCNDQGLLYGSVTQQDVANALVAAGFTVRPRDVRITQTIKRIDHYDILIRPEVDLEATVKLHVKSDRPLEQRREEAAPAAAPAEAQAPGAEEAAPAEAEAKPKKGKGEKAAAGEGEKKPKKSKKDE